MISIAYPAFYTSFKNHYPDLVNIVELNGQINYAAIFQSDLIIFPGGEDISPEIYGEKNLHSHFNPNRDDIETLILQIALNLNTKILGVCRGHQLINAYLGGKMVQDIWAQLKKYHGGEHYISKTKGSIIDRFFTTVNSMHHQGVISPGKGLTPTSIYNGVIESTESDNILTVQFHPEFMMGTNDFFNYVKEEWANV